MLRLASFLLLLYLVSCTAAPEFADPSEAPPTRGVWLTNVDSEAMFSKAGIQAAVDHCHRLGFNTIFAVTWNRGYTLYPSQIMEETFGQAIDPRLAGRDPLQELIEAAHAVGIRVIAWFEFGFSSSYAEADGGRLLRARPQWAAIDSLGEIATKNQFQWMNAFDPEVQDFLLSLLREVVQEYDIDGIQGDDRLPALPSEAGYDPVTLDRFRQATGFTSMPAQYDSLWIDWRAGQLNLFMQRIHKEIKAIDPGTIISVSPSIYPWSKEEYLQDWPTWVREGWVDMVCPQIYRYEIDKYRLELRRILQEQVTPADLEKLFPGILLKVGDYVASDTFLSQMVAENRKYGIQGEVFFFYEGLKLRPAFLIRSTKINQLYEKPIHPVLHRNTP